MDKENQCIVTDLSEEKHTLDNLEESLKSLQVRIQFLLKEESKNKKKL
jgi:hypothetical protein